MKTLDTEGKLVGVGIGGRKNAVASFSIAIEFYLSEYGDGGFADVVLDRAPDLLAAMRAKSLLPQTTHTMAAEQLFDGQQAHAFALWGLPEASRQPNAKPIIRSNGANIKGAAKFVVNYGDGVGNVSCKCTLSVKVPTGLLGELSLRDVGSQLHGDCWVDLEQLQTEADDVEPTNRTAGERAASQAEIDWNAAEDDGDTAYGHLDDEIELTGGDMMVVMTEVPEHFLGVARFIEELPDDAGDEEDEEGLAKAYGADKARQLCQSVKEGNHEVVIDDLDTASAEHIVAKIEAAGGVAHVAEMERDADADAEGESEDDEIPWEEDSRSESQRRYDDFKASLPEKGQQFLTLLKVRGTVTISEVVDKLSLNAPKAVGGITGTIGRWAPVRGVPLPYEETEVDGEKAWRWIGVAETAEEMAQQVASRDTWAPFSAEDLKNLGDAELSAYLGALDLGQLGRQHAEALGKPTRSQNEDFIRKAITNALAG